MAIVLMDPNRVRELIQGEPDILTRAVAMESEKYAALRCPVCSASGCIKVVEPTRITTLPDGSPQLITPFGSDMLPRGFARCVQCNTDFDPQTSVIRKSDATVIASSSEDPPLAPR